MSLMDLCSRLRDGGGPAAFDPSDFPSLAPGVGAPGGMPGRPNYGMVFTAITFDF